MINPNNKWRRYNTSFGICINEKCETVTLKYLMQHYRNCIQLIFTSPPFPLNRAKKYGNLNGEEYQEWLCSVIESLLPCLTDDGSIVIEIGNAWNPGEPTFSTLPMETLLKIKEQCKLYLCQEFIYYNPAKLPTPIQYVNIDRSRVKDSFTRIWWLSKSPNPKSNNKNVLKQYSTQMQKLLKTGKYNSGNRPSEHNISETAFNTDNGGAIPSNVIISSNTNSQEEYLVKCKEKGLKIHPARMPIAVPEFFINFLTEKGDIVLDCFSGSNTTGYCSEKLGRRWISIEADKDYYFSSKCRFGK